jgi:hypothetical protein
MCERVSLVDRNDMQDPQLVAEYAEDCCVEMFKQEKIHTA